MTEPGFVLHGPSATVTAFGTRRRFDDAGAAAAALRDGTAPMVVGALSFDGPAALVCPERVEATLPALPPAALPAVRIGAAQPEPDVHRARIRAALDRLRDGADPLEKVVLARALELTADAAIDPLAVLRRLIDADPQAWAYLADLSAAGPDYTGCVLVGASPELLVARFGDEVSCRPFAGSAARCADPAVDARNGAALAASAKNRHEHQLVVDTMHAALRPLCSRLDVAAEPQLSRTAEVWHLSTPIRGTLRDSATTALDLALLLHPTPAVGGAPRAAAMDLIGELEGERGFYAGAVGWCDAAGDGRWVVAIRGAQLSADRLSAVATAGGGIVAESDADDELTETTTKFRTILSAFGVTT